MPNINIGTNRQKLNELLGQRATLLSAAQTDLDQGNRLDYLAKLEQARGMNSQIDDLQALVNEYDKYDIAHAPVYGTDRYDLEDMGRSLIAGKRVSFDPQNVLHALRTNSVNFSGQIVSPTGGGGSVQDGHNAQVSTLIDQVWSESYIGLSSWEEPYLKQMQEATSGSIAAVGGTTRQSSDPQWRKAKLMATEIQTTAFVDKNILDLSPVNYAQKVQEYALKALRRKGNYQIINGDAKASHEMFGILNGKNTDGENIFQAMTAITAIDKDTLRSLVFGYGGDEEVSANAKLVLSKKSLDAFGRIPISATDSRKLFEITQQGNTGTIKEGGLIVNYIIASAMGDSHLAYGDPMLYQLGLFGAYSIRVDESVKSVERQIAILGDVKVGGNLVADKAFSVVTLSDPLVTDATS